MFSTQTTKDERKEFFTALYTKTLEGNLIWVESTNDPGQILSTRFQHERNRYLITISQDKVMSYSINIYTLGQNGVANFPIVSFPLITNGTSETEIASKLFKLLFMKNNQSQTSYEESPLRKITQFINEL